MRLDASTLARLRADTPGCQTVTHFNNAGASLPPRPVVERVKAHLDAEMRLGPYEAAAACADELDDVLDAIAELIGCGEHEVALTQSATQSWQLIVHSLPLQEGQRILTSASEYGSNLIGLIQLARRRGCGLQVIPDDGFGQIDVTECERQLKRGGVGLIALTHVPTNGGLVNPVSAIGALARAHDVPFLLDACQSVGQLQLSVAELGCDFLVSSGRKYLRAPRGAGFLYVARSRLDALDPVFLDFRGAALTSLETFELAQGARRLESFEASVACRLGLGVAVRYALSTGMEAIEAEVRALAASLRGKLSGIQGVTLQDKGVDLCGLVSFSMEGLSASHVVAELAKRKINTSRTARGLTYIDMTEREQEEFVRASVHCYNTESETDFLCGALEDMKKAQVR